MDGSKTCGQRPVFKDRKLGLMVFGLVQAGLGCLCGLMVPLMLFGLAASRAARVPGVPPMEPRLMLPGLLIYVALAAWFIGVGVGSILAKRWARALVLAASWIWLVSGLGGMLMVWLLLPDVYAQMVAKNQLSAGLASLMVDITLVFMALLYVAFPGALLLFYSGRNVKATCELRNPEPAWTDACPLPILALCLLFTSWACCLLPMGCYSWTMPFFGTVLSGAAGAAVTLATAGALAYAAWKSYRLDVRGWACSLALVLAWALSTGLTFSRISLLDFYAAMQLPSEQLEQLKPVCAGHSPILAALGACWVAALLGFLLYTRRFFPRDGRTDAAPDDKRA